MKVNNWSCLPVAFAKVLQVSLKEVTDFCGHDGSEILFPELNDPGRRRGFHIQEMIEYSLTLNYATVGIEAIPTFKSKIAKGFPIILKRTENRLVNYLKQYDGVLTGEINNRRHAVAWLNREVQDSFRLEEFGIETFWMILKLS